MTASDAFLQQAAAHLQAGRPWGGLAGDALAFVLADVAATGRWLVVVDDADRAAQLLTGLRFFHPHPGRIEAFPADDNRPYDGFSPDPALARQRLKTLERVDRGGDLIVVATARALIKPVPDRATRRRGSRTLSPGDRLDRDELIAWLSDGGYLSTGRADEPARFAVRGDVVDIWPASARSPVRVDFFDDEIESLRRLDPRTLRPRRPTPRITLLPGREDRIDAVAVEHAAASLGALVTTRGDGAVERRRFLDDLRAGVRSASLAESLPVLVPTVAPLDALAELSPLVVMPGDVAAALRDFETTARRRYETLEVGERPLVPPEIGYLPAGPVVEILAGWPSVHDLPTDRAVDFGARPTDDLAVRGSDLGPVVGRLLQLAGEDVRVGLVVEGEDRAQRLLEMLAPHGLHPRREERVSDLRRGKVSVLVGDLARGFVASASGWAVVPVSVLFGGRRRTSERAHALFEGAVTSMAQLKVGDPVVHRLHGVGRYLGLVRLTLQRGTTQDVVKLAYRGDDHMFLPVSALQQLSRYAPANSEAKVVLDRLGGQTWSKRKGKVRDTLLAMAQDLLRLHATRELATRDPLPPVGDRFRAFEARFPHEETPDQATAISAVLADLARPFPMDRLVAGDVGFGKTEVAMRAAMRMIEGGRQVVVLCPTTVLAYQHHQSFQERFAVDADVEVAMLSRFVGGAEEARVRAGLADGSIDVVVGTTAVLGRSIRYARLGLVVVDEEHRFGVKQKERLKRMRAEVDLLSMSATPIPRTLQLALSGAREMSVITTPPLGRLSVRTSVARLSPARIRDAVGGEIERGGQCFVIHNRVETIDAFAKTLGEWMPEVRIAVAHGQMAGDALERVLVSFIAGEIDVLVCTTIVESGVDLPNVNTLLVHRADLFGLAQLYQLRGRVGRSDRRAQCVLLVPESVSAEARKRLRVIVENQRLGSGFSVASADLELRGGGNLLGAAQSGNIDQVGYDTWVELLEEAVRMARGDLERAQIDPEVEVPVDAFLPDDYVRDTAERLDWYKRLAHTDTPAQVEGILDDLEGEFGEPPPPARNLAGLMTTRLLCRDLGLVRASFLKVRVVFVRHEASPLDDTRIAAVVAAHPRRFSAADDRIEVRFTPAESERPFRFLRWALAQLSRGAA